MMYLKTDAGWVDLSPRLVGSVYDAPLHPASLWHTPCAALAALTDKHPRARIAPPFRQVHCVLKGHDTPDIGSEVTVALDSGFFVGFIMETKTGYGVEMRLEEAGAVLPAHCREHWLEALPQRRDRLPE